MTTKADHDARVNHVLGDVANQNPGAVDHLLGAVEFRERARKLVGWVEPAEDDHEDDE